MAEQLARIYGTEQDKNNCPFFLKTGLELYFFVIYYFMLTFIFVFIYFIIFLLFKKVLVVMVMNVTEST